MAQQIYMIEFLIDKVLVYVSEDDNDTDTNKGFIIQMKFGPNDVVNFKENHLAEVKRKDAVVACEDQNNSKTWNRSIRVGKSYLFPSYPDQIVITLSKFPIEFTLWTDGLKEVRELIGNGIMYWDPKFYQYLKENDDPRYLHESFALKQRCTLYHDTCSGRAGEIDIILRFSALGETITTEFQQILKKDHFVFRSDKAPTMFRCERIQGNDINFTMVGNIYETITLEDPQIIDKMNQKIEICTEIQSCQPRGPNNRIPKEIVPKNIKMGDIAGPCGNTNCPLAHKIKAYLRTLSIYTNETKGKQFADKNANKDGRNVCGKCGCKEDKWHRDTCPEINKKPVCEGCGGIARSGETCEDRVNKAYGSKQPDEKKDKQINYLTSITRDSEQERSIFGQTFIVNPCEITYPNPHLLPTKNCTCGQSREQKAVARTFDPGRSNPASTSRSMGNISAFVYNADVKPSSTKFCTDMPDEKDKECKCNPPKLTPPCKTFDCECLARAEEKETRKHHKTYCPLYKHKASCPVTKMNDEEVPEFEEEEPEVLPYGLPPVQLGPCPVIGRPCSVPDGFARLYKNAVLPTRPLSYSDAGKICCSAEFNRVKKAILEYMAAHEKEDDYRCLNKFNVDTERRCCDKEQRLLALLGKSCCGSHKNQPSEEKPKK